MRPLESPPDVGKVLYRKMRSHQYGIFFVDERTFLDKGHITLELLEQLRWGSIRLVIPTIPLHGVMSTGIFINSAYFLFIKISLRSAA